MRYHSISGPSFEQLGKGSKVTLSSECTDHELLKPGDVGEIIEDDGSDIPFMVSDDYVWSFAFGHPRDCQYC